MRFAPGPPFILVLTLLASLLSTSSIVPAITSGSPQEEVRELALDPGEESVRAAVADPSHGFAYFALYTSPGQIVKVKLSDFSRAGTLTLNLGEDNPTTAVLDSEAGFAYFGLSTAPGMIVKVSLSDFTRVASLTLGPGEDYVTSSVIDVPAGYAYFGVGTPGGSVVKVRLSDFTRVGSVMAAPDKLSTAAIDAGRGFAYFGTFTGRSSLFSPPKAATIVKVRLSDLAVVANVTLGVGQEFLSSSIIDPGNDHAYFGTGEPGVIARIRLSDSSRSGVLSPIPGWNSLTSAVFDPAKGIAYFGSWSAIVKVRLTDFNQVGTFWVGGGDLGAAAIDPAGGHAYFATGGRSGFTGKIIRIPLSEEPDSDYSISAAPYSLTLEPGTSAPVTLALTGFNYTRPVTLSISTTSRYVEGPEVTTDKTTVWPGGCGASTATLDILTRLTTPPAFYYVTVTGTAGGLSRYLTIEVLVGQGEPDVVITADPSRLLIERGSYAYSSVWVHSVGGFQGNVAFSSTVSPLIPNGPTVTPATASFPILPGTMTGVPLTVNTTPETPSGNYNVTLEAVSGPESDRLVIPVTVYENAAGGDAGFKIWADRETIQLSRIAPETVTIGLSSQNGFFGGVLVSTDVLPSGPDAPSTIVSPANVSLYADASNIAVLTISADESTPAGNYTLKVTGTSRNGAHSITITVTVDPTNPFELAGNTGLTFEAGSSATTGILLSSHTSGHCTVQLSTDSSSLPEGAEAKLSSSLVTVADRTSVSIQLTVSSPAPGSFEVQVTGVGGSFIQSVVVNVIVAAAQSPSGGTPALFGDTPVLFAFASIVAVAVSLSVYVLRRKRTSFSH